MKTTLDLDDDLLMAAKALAVRRRTTLKAMVEHALRREIAPASAGKQADDFIEIAANSLPRLKRSGVPFVITSEMVYSMMDEEGI